MALSTNTRLRSQLAVEMPLCWCQIPPFEGCQNMCKTNICFVTHCKVSDRQFINIASVYRQQRIMNWTRDKMSPRTPYNFTSVSRHSNYEMSVFFFFSMYAVPSYFSVCAFFFPEYKACWCCCGLLTTHSVASTMLEQRPKIPKGAFLCSQ